MLLNKPKTEAKPKRLAEPSRAGGSRIAMSPAPIAASASAIRAWAQQGSPSMASSDLTGYAISAEARSLTLYRADGRRPQLLREKGGMQSKENKPLAEIKELLAQNPRSFEQSHVSNNLPYLVSTATDEEAGGYATNDGYLYRVSVHGLYKFEQSPPARNEIMRKPTIYTNTPSFQDATIVLMATSKDTDEVDFFTGIPLEFITACRAPGDNSFHSMDSYSGDHPHSQAHPTRLPHVL
ncbi:hypothetical protein [Streptomyces sp. NPDC055709]